MEGNTCSLFRYGSQGGPAENAFSIITLSFRKEKQATKGCFDTLDHQEQATNPIVGCYRLLPRPTPSMDKAVGRSRIGHINEGRCKFYVVEILISEEQKLS